MLDEAGMVDSVLFYRLISAIDFENQMLLIVGDSGQLKSIGSGDILHDIVEFNLVKGVKLDKVFRQSEKQAINYFATEYIRKGKEPYGYKTKKFEDFLFRAVEIENYYVLKNSLTEKEMKEVREKNKKQTTEEIKKIALRAKEKITSFWDKKDYWSYITLFQVITPMKNGLLGTIHLNTAIQNILNPIAQKYDELKVVDTTFRYKDKVVHLKNKNMNTMDYQTYIKKYHNNIERLQESEDDIVERKIFNGQLGVLLNLNKQNDIVVCYYPHEDIVVFCNSSHFREKIVNLAYALTVHKTQGSEFENVILPMTMSHFIMLSTALLYTAVTRAKKRLFVVGESMAWERACKNIDSLMRNTVIKERVGKEIG